MFNKLFTTRRLRVRPRAVTLWAIRTRALVACWRVLAMLAALMVGLLR